ncbi:MAG: discoidin domain-containing protein [Krumholzibacteria bacterium]|nr:discoidin domain-containing protein [Candidatus Krumholzibacteria bacterium]
MRTRALVVAATLLALSGCREDAPPAVVVIDAGEDATAWTAHPADGVVMDLGTDQGERGRALRLDFRFTGGGWAIARRDVDLALPEDYTIRFRLRGEAPANTLELKLLDASGENVWWRVWRDVSWPADWTTFSARKRQIEFAWGPQGGGELRQVAAIEFAVTAGSGGQGTVWIDDLELVPREVPDGPPPAPVAVASSVKDAGLVLDGDPATAWAAAAGDTAPVLTVDFGRAREYGGLVIDWAPDGPAADYTIEVDEGDGAWRQLVAVTGGNGGRDYLYLPESESRRLRLRLPPGAAVAELAFPPWEWSATREAFFGAIAQEARRGLYPRGMLDEQVYWTVAGVDADTREGLLAEDGALETGPRRFSVEPFLWTDGQLLTWADGRTEVSLGSPLHPYPQVLRRAGSLYLNQFVFAVGEPQASALLVRYKLGNEGAADAAVTLAVALRPFQVNPPSQFLNLTGGTAPVHAIARDGDRVLVDGEVGVVVRTPADRFGAVTFAGGDVVAEHLEHGRLPGAQAVHDPFGAASAALAWDLVVPAGSSTMVDVLVPLHGVDPLSPGTAAADSVIHAGQLTSMRALQRVGLFGPPAAEEALATVYAQLQYILVNRAGPAIQPGARSYARSWIRDGALTGEALLRLGREQAVREFLEWFAPHQYADGKIPCVVDHRGADPVPEHDSTGEFIHLVTEYYRYTGDRALLDAMWPRVVAGIGYLETLLAERRTDEYRAADKREFYGILPPSISHEGYSAKPMHSYWDDFWALRGYRDAVFLAGELGQAEERDRLAGLRDRFATDLGASVAAAMARHGIDYVPGCADLGDFDPTSTTMAVTPAAAGSLLPEGSLERTFTRYWEFFSARRAGEPWDAFTPYELRNVGAFVRLGWRGRAQEALDWFMGFRRPAGWRHWAEVVGRDERAARFIGDMPHTWVGSDYVRSVLDMLAYERRDEEGEPAALVLAAGVPEAWLEGPGLGVDKLRTPWGPLGYELRRTADGVVMEVGSGVRIPPGGLVLRPPGVGGRASVDGREVAAGPDGEVVLRQVPATVVWRD